MNIQLKQIPTWSVIKLNLRSAGKQDSQVNKFLTHDPDVFAGKTAWGYLERHVLCTHGTVQPSDAHFVLTQKQLCPETEENDQQSQRVHPCSGTGWFQISDGFLQETCELTKGAPHLQWELTVG